MLAARPNSLRGAPALVFVAAGVEIAAAALHDVTDRPLPDFGYWVLCAGFLVALALASSLLGRFTRRPEITASGVWTLTVAGFLWGPVAGLLGAVGAALATRWLLLAGRAGLALGWVLGSTLFLADVGWPAVVRRLPQADALPGVGPAILVFGLLLACCALERYRRNAGIGVIGLCALTMLVRSWDPPLPVRVDWPADLVRTADPERPSILLLVLDTVGAEHLSAYGAARETSPFLTHLVESEGAALFSNAYANAPWTGPSHASLFTGEIPSVHGIHYRSIQASESRGAAIRAEVVLAEQLRDVGYLTAAVIANRGLSWVDGIERGFDVFHYPPESRPARGFGEAVRQRVVPYAYAHQLAPYPDAERVNEALLHLIGSAGDRPFFLVANYMEAHSPYVPRPPYRARFTGRAWIGFAGRPRFDLPPAVLDLASSRYDEELAGLDARLRELWQALQALRRDNNTWIFITADHGEAFGRHGTTGHGGSVYNDQIRIPLLVRAPRGASSFEESRRHEPVSLVDVGATIAAIGAGTGLGQGRDLRAPAPAPVRAEFFGDTQPFRIRIDGPVDIPSRSVVLGERKLVERGGELELYDLRADPIERAPLRMTPEERALLEPLLPPLTYRPAPELAPAEASPETMEALRALGYLE